MTWILCLRERRLLEPEDRIRAAFVLVRHPLAKPVDVEAVVFQPEVSEHVVEGAVLEHQHDDVLDLVERADGLV